MEGINIVITLLISLIPSGAIAFVCMNLQFTMTVEQAASAVNAFKPGVVIPITIIEASRI